MKIKNNVVRYCRVNENLSFVYDCKGNIEYKLDKIASDLFESYIKKENKYNNKIFNEFIRRLEYEDS